jgi:UDP-N-acetylmuramoyl-tripeptide--D-alanyl-D-alanine ligase
LPLSIFAFDDDIEAAVLEMGAETLGEIHRLADIARPDIAIITNIGLSHIETFGSRENILKGKMEIVDYFGNNNLIVLNGENDLLSKVKPTGDYRIETIGGGEGCSFLLSGVDESHEGGIEFSLTRGKESNRFKLNVMGRHNAINASLAIAAALEIGVSMEEAERGLINAEITGERLAVKVKDRIKVIDDTYNASPDSMRAALDVLFNIKGNRKIAVLGDMLGLGNGSRHYHEEIGEYAARKNIDMLITAGSMAAHISDKAKEFMKSGGSVIHYDDRRSLEAVIGNIIAEGDVILVKGSRATAMENIVEKILE